MGVRGAEVRCEPPGIQRVRNKKGRPSGGSERGGRPEYETLLDGRGAFFRGVSYLRNSRGVEAGELGSKGRKEIYEEGYSSESLERRSKVS